MTNTKTFRANGKLLISGEYLVLNGAKSLVVPLKMGQTLKVIDTNDISLLWKAFEPDGLWFEAVWSADGQIIHTNNQAIADRLYNILQAATQNNFRAVLGKAVETRLDFNRAWGFGSSSTLISCIAQWLNIDDHQLLQTTFGGSGYDVAAATQQQPFIYSLKDELPVIETCLFQPAFANQIYFVYSGKKQNSQDEVSRFKKSIQPTDKTIQQCTGLTMQLLAAKTTEEFGQLIEQHEALIGSIVHQKQLKIEHFSDFNGYLKSLGAWGGDFFMAISNEPNHSVRAYFKDKGYETLFSYNDLVLQQ